MPVTDEGMQHQKSTSPSGEPSSALTSSSSPKTGMRRLFNRRSISNSKRPARTSAAEPQPTTSASTPASSRSANVPSACVYENGAGGALTTSATALPEGGPAQAEISPAARFASSADPLPSKSIESAQGRRGGDLAEDAVRDVSSPPPSILASANASTSGLASRRPSAAGLQLQTFNLPDPGITFSPAPDSRDSPTPMAGSPKARNRQAAMLHAVNSAESSSSRAEEATSATSGISSGRTPRRLIHRIAASTDNGGSSSHEANTGTNGVNPRSPHPFRALAGSRSRHHVGIGRPVRSGTFIPAPGQVIEERRVSLPGAEPVVPSFHPAAPIALRAPNESQPLTSPLADPVDIEAGSEEVAPNGARAHTLRLQRPQIKIRCITWNHGNSVPKGDLEVLLGRVGEYVPPEPGWDESGDEDETENAPSEAGAKDEQVAEKKAPKSKGKGVAGQESIPRKDRIPPLVADDAHPYHVIVIAGQECPWGDGKRLAAGVALAGELSDLARSKSRAIPKEKDREKEEKEREKKERREEKEREKREEKERLKREKDAAKANGKELALQEDKQAGSHSGKIVDGEDTGPTTRDGGVPHSASLSEMRVQDFGAMAPSIPPSPMPATSAVDGYFESPAFSPPQSGVPMTPLAAGSFPFLGLGGGGGVKGWSEMCEAWLCHGPVAQLSAIKGTPASLAQLANSSSTATPNPMSETSTEIEPSVAASRTNTPIPISGSKHDVPKLKLRTDALSVGGGKSAPEDGKHKQALSPSTPLDGPALGAAGGSPAKKSALAAAAGLATSHALAVPHSISRNNSSSRLAPTSFGSVADLPSPGLLSPSEFGLIREPSPPEQKTKIEEQEPPTLQTQEQSSSHHRHLISRFGQHHDGTPRTLGPYELVMKERCYMMYMAVYVFRGALDRVRGVSRGHVKSGLLAGRVGNKGGVGISLKLGLTRLLFVNAHLAAHEGKVAERIANVEKIKRELKVDTFLPETESQDEDITARFDHCFWMGDLNFRVDITRKHADWLLMQKRYDQALEFDQLRKVMRETSTFHGFTEAAISFMPTFKYDVLKTLKSKNEKDLKRHVSVRKRLLHRHEGSLPDLGISPAGAGIAAATSEGKGGPEETLGSRNGDLSSSPHHSQRSGASRRRQNLSDRIAAALGQSTDTEDDSSSIATTLETASILGLQTTRSASGSIADREALANNTAAAAETPLISRGKAIRVKGQLMKVVQAVKGHRSQAGSPPAHNISPLNSPLVPSRQGQGLSESSHNAAWPAQKAGASEKALGAHSSDRALSDKPVGSSPQDPSAPHSLRTSSSLEDWAMNGSVSARGSPSPASKGRRVSVQLPNEFGVGHRRRSSADDAGEMVSSLDGATLSAMAASGNIADVDVQRYDTSTKQRVPSWCDRVLWRSNVKIEAEEGHAEDGAGDTRASRVTTALSKAGAQLRSATFRRNTDRADGPSVTFAPPPKVPVRGTSIAGPKLLQDSPTATQAPAPNGSSEKLARTHGGAAHDQAVRRRWFGRRHKLKRSQTLDAETSDRAGLSTLKEMSASNGRANSAVNLPSHLRRQNSTASSSRPPGSPQSTRLFPRRSSSTRTAPSSAAMPAAQGSSTPDGAEGKGTPPISSARSSPFNFVSSRMSAARPSSPSPRGSPGFRREPLEQASPGSNAPTSVDTELARGLAAPPVPTKAALTASPAEPPRRTSWWAERIGVHLPSLRSATGALLPFSLSAALARSQEPAEPTQVLVGPKKGEVQCLLYKSLDDREMRQLEGRSDHRPVIFVAAVGV